VSQKNGNECKRQWTYRGRTYTSCTNDFTTNGEAWCATRVRDDGTAIRAEDCDPSVCEVPRVCIVTSGPDRYNSCKFPFRFNGRTYNSCQEWTWGGQHHGKYWCSTMTDRRNEHVSGEGNYGFCPCRADPVCGCPWAWGPQPLSDFAIAPAL